MASLLWFLAHKTTVGMSEINQSLKSSISEIHVDTKHGAC